jgi:hypothetical protein
MYYTEATIHDTSFVVVMKNRLSVNSLVVFNLKKMKPVFRHYFFYTKKKRKSAKNKQSVTCISQKQ